MYSPQGQILLPGQLGPSNQPQPQEPGPSAALLGQAWRINFKHFGIFLLLAFIDFAVSSMAGDVERNLGTIFGIPIDPDKFTNAQWMLSRGFNILTTGVFSVPFEVAVYSVCFRLLAGAINPLEGLGEFVRFFPRALQFGVTVELIRTALQLIIRLVAPPDEVFFDIALMFLVDVPLMLAVAAMVRYDWSAWDAMRYSWQRVGRGLPRFVLYFLGAGLMSLCGLLACIFGLILTMEIYNIAIALLFVPPMLAYPAGPAQPGVSPYPRYPGQP